MSIDKSSLWKRLESFSSKSLYPWERRLLELAYEAFESSWPHKSQAPEAVERGRTPSSLFQRLDENDPDSLSANTRLEVDERVLEGAYDHCESLIKSHSRTFHLTSGLLSADKRRAARALYAFCRISDDLVDRSAGDLQAGLDTWRERAMVERPPDDDLVALAWADARVRYGIPPGYAEQLIEGVARDLVSVRYATFDDLTEYCYGVAATVGLMVMYIIGFSGPEAIPYAVRLGVALQLTNILRDVAEDWQAGRVYLPQDELAEFGLTEADIAAGNADERWRAFMRFQVERNRRLYTDALPGIALLHPDGRFAIAAAAELYRAILDDIEAHDWDVFHRRAYVSTWGKLQRLPGIWWRARALSYSRGSLECQEACSGGDDVDP